MNIFGFAVDQATAGLFYAWLYGVFFGFLFGFFRFMVFTAIERKEA